MIRAVLTSLFFLLYLPLACLFGLALAWLLDSTAILYRLARIGVHLGLRLAGTAVHVEGKEHVGDGRNVVLISNHVSHLDAPVLLEGLDVDWKAVAKKELFRTPLFGRVLRRAGFVPLDRSDRRKAHASIGRAAESLRAGNCLLIFPEGTRSPTGELGEFKKGGFVAALQAGSRIVPVVVMGSGELNPRGRFALRPGRVRVRVLDPVDAGRYSYADRDRLLAEVRGRMAAALAG